MRTCSPVLRDKDVKALEEASALNEFAEVLGEVKRDDVIARMLTA